MNTHDNAMQELRELLFKSESERISEIERILNNQELHAQEIAKVLAEAVKIRSKADHKLGQALTPAVEEALKASIARDPKPISDALFPVMGPAIRKAINSSIAAMMQSLNQTLEHSFSAQGLRWRLDAWRTGKPFAEVVLLNTLVYRVEQVFLIHKETGLLLHHLSFDPALNEDADVVSSMLTAVRDFIHDSFSGGDEQSIENLRMGDLEIMIEQGPDVVLALVVRGNPPRTLHDKMQPTLEDIQQEFHEELQHFEGNSDDFDTADILLSKLMVADYQSPNKEGSTVKPIIVIVLLLLGVIGWFAWSYQQHAALENKWQQYIQSLVKQPGIIITNVSQDDGHYTLTGLRDPLSIDPIKALESSGLPKEDLELQLQPYQALQEPLILKRVSALLQPPQTAKLALHDSTLHLSGTAPSAWIQHAVTTAPFVAGIQNVDASHIAPATSLIERIKAVLKPTGQVNLKLANNHQLVVSGKATTAWATQAKANIQSIQSIDLYDDHELTRVDSPEYLVLQAYKALQPPKTIQLFVTPQLVLIAKGSASTTWIQQAQQKATQLPYITAYRDTQVSSLDNIALQRAINALQPPETVTLSLNQHILTATGAASQAWIDMANKKATAILGVDSFNNQASLLRDDAVILAEAIQHLQPPKDVKLTFSNHTLYASGNTSNAWIKQAKTQYTSIKGIQQFDTSKLKNTSETWRNIQEKTAQVHIKFPPTIAQLTPAMNEKIKSLAALFKQASTLQKDSFLKITAPYQRNDVFITSLRLKSIKKALIAQSINPKHITTEVAKSTKNQAQDIQILLTSSGNITP